MHVHVPTFDRTEAGDGSAPARSLMKNPGRFGSWFVLPWLLVGCVTAVGPSPLDKFADHQRFIAHLPAAFLVVDSPRPHDTTIKQWLEELPPDKKPVVLTMSGEERAALRTAVKSPQFPMQMLREGMSGDAEFLFMVDKRGNVIDLCVLDKSRTQEEPLLLAIDACRYWKFTPMQLAGRPAVAVIYHKMSFDVRSKPSR